MKITWTVVLYCLLLSIQALYAKPDTEPRTALDGETKIGLLNESESWSGNIYLLGDITIPKGKILKIKPGTTIYFADYDLLQSGNDPTKCEIIVHGDLDVQSTETKPVRLFQLNQGQYELISTQGRPTQILKFDPYVVETEPIRQEFRQFKNQYIILWSLVYLLAYTQLTY